ncbi:MAG: WS/DGAT/MGAT family O-acyltransferase [Panacagrimonas sp.]
MKRLNGLDLGFISLEKRNQPLHVAYLNLLTPPPDAPPDFVQKLVERLRSYAAPLPPFNQRLESRLGAAYWVEDPEFDIDQHVIHLSLPKPGGIKQLLAMVSRMHASHLDRAYPLWRLYLIEGLEGGRIATYSKMHHAVADGIAGTRLMLKSMSADPEEQLAPPWAIAPRGRSRRQHALDAPVKGLAMLANIVRGAVASVPVVVRELHASRQEWLAKSPDFVGGLDAPPSILNQRISASRRYAAQSYSLIRVRAVAAAQGCTTNDVVLAMCAAALRRYLLDLDALPSKPLIAMVPVSMRRDHSETGNQIALLLANLGTHLADPLARLHAITGSVDRAKRRFMAMKPAEVLAYSLTMTAPGMLNLLIGRRDAPLPFNLIISNVPGPRQQMYWQGCRVDGMYPVSVLTDGMALNISLTGRRGDWIDFGILACRRTLPSVQHFIDYLEAGLVELEQLSAPAAQAVVVKLSRAYAGNGSSRVPVPPQ